MAKYHVDKEALKIFTRWSDHLRLKDRFHLPEKEERLVNEVVDYSMEHRSVTIGPRKTFYRTRVNKSDNEEIKPIEKMGAPPQDGAKAGRLNPVGIPYLYLSDDIDTSIAEVRPWLGAIVTVASFVPKKDIKIVNLNYRDAKADELQVGKGAVGEYKAFLMFMSQTLAKPQNPDREILYIPTQFLAERFKWRGVDGIMYQSVLKEPGSNLVLFNPDMAEETGKYLYEIETVNYQSKLKEYT